MDETGIREKEVAIDLENGGTTSEEEEEEIGNKESFSMLGQIWSGFLSDNGSVKGVKNGGISSNSPENTEVLIGKKSQGEESVRMKKPDKESGKKKNSSRVSSKPPRPPRGPSLDAADQKLIREIAALAMLKRARIERMKAQKKLKAAKVASSNSNLCAMIITFIFCLVLIFQGMSSKGRPHMSLQGSPQSAVGMRGSSISIQYYNKKSADRTDKSDSLSPSLLEQVYGSAPREEAGSKEAG